MMLRLERSFWTISDGAAGFKSRLNLEAVDDGVEHVTAGERLPTVPAVEGVETLPYPLLTDPLVDTATDDAVEQLGTLPDACLSHIANSAFTLSCSDSDVASPPEETEAESFESEDSSDCFTVDVAAPTGIVASVVSMGSDTDVEDFLTGVDADAATCSKPSLGSCGRSEVLALMAMVGGGILS
jgi:hypothetical protein